MIPVFSRWVTLVFSIGCMIAAGTAYSFGLYSGDIKTTMHYTQPQIDTLALSSSMGNYFSFNSGWIYDRFGGRITIIVGAVCTFGGYFLLWAAVSGWWKSEYWQVAIFCALWGHGSSWFDTAILGTTFKNFPYANQY